MSMIHQLRLTGLKIKVHHYRNFNIQAKKNNEMRFTFGDFYRITPKGGRTVVTITDTNGDVFTGESICSIKDNYCRKTGARIALERAAEKALVVNY